MALYRPSELLQFLQEIGKKPTRSLSQNFLIDGNIVQKILHTCDVHQGDLVVEIGPGPGVLTEAILSQGAHLIAIEKDELLAKHLQRLGGENQLEIFCQDFLDFPLKEALKSRLKKHEKAKIIASPPYHITTPILERLIPCHEMISHVVLILQEEFVRRIVSKGGRKEYGAFSVFVQSYAKATNAGVISRNCFYPSPKVDSAILLLEMTPPPFPIQDMERFYQMVQKAFQQRRKKMFSALSDLYDKKNLTEAFKHVGLSEDIRAEACSPMEFEKLFFHLNISSEKNKLNS